MTQLVRTIPPELNELRAASTASGGTALTATLGQITLPFGADYVSITPRALAGAAVVKVALNPYLRVFYTRDAGGSITDISDEMQDGDATDHPLDDFPLTGTGFIYVGARLPFRGVAITMGDKNDDATVLTVKYPLGKIWTDISDTDGTDVGGDSMKQDGSVTWTVPAGWTKTSLSVMGDTLPAYGNKFSEQYWTRWEWSAALDASIDVRTMLALNRSTAYAEYVDGQTVELMLNEGREVGNIEALTNAGTANLVVNVGTLVGSEFE